MKKATARVAFDVYVVKTSFTLGSYNIQILFQIGKD